jgi:UDP-2,4-diacetamido-2,4,6-trideoxy-beta-L-altropyranose hydrolase
MKSPNVRVRVDSSREIGSGHLMRCLALADALRGEGCRISFISKDLQGSMSYLVEEKGYPVYRLPGRGATPPSADAPAHALRLGADWETDACETLEALGQGDPADWLIVDHYALDARWEERLRVEARRIMVIDDLADRRHECDLLLDCNYYREMESRYRSLVPSHCRKLLGPKYVLLRPEFAGARATLRQRHGRVQRIQVFFGGADRTDETSKVIESIALLGDTDLSVDVVVGGMNDHKQKIERICASSERMTYYCQTDNMAELTAGADLAICAGGTSTWERCCLGLPALVVTTAKNQVKAVADLAEGGYLVIIGESDNVTAGDIAGALRLWLEKPDSLARLSSACMDLVDGLGTGRCAKAILQ